MRSSMKKIKQNEWPDNEWLWWGDEGKAYFKRWHLNQDVIYEDWWQRSKEWVFQLEKAEAQRSRAETTHMLSQEEVK